MSEPKLEDIDMSAADKEHLGLPEGSRKPFHEALVGIIMSVSCEYHVKQLLDIIRSSVIPRGHDAIVGVIRMKSQQISSSWWGEMEQVVHEQKAEAEVCEAEKQKRQIADTEKVLLKKKVDALADLAVIASTHNVSVVTTVAKIQNASSLEEIFEIMQTWSRV